MLLNGGKSHYYRSQSEAGGSTMVFPAAMAQIAQDGALALLWVNLQDLQGISSLKCSRGITSSGERNPMLCCSGRLEMILNLWWNLFESA